MCSAAFRGSFTEAVWNVGKVSVVACFPGVARCCASLTPGNHHAPISWAKTHGFAEPNPWHKNRTTPIWRSVPPKTRRSQPLECTGSDQVADSLDVAIEGAVGGEAFDARTDDGVGLFDGLAAL